MAFPEIPPELVDLRPLEESLVSLRVPFMQIRELPRGRQLSFKGNVVNVLVDFCSTVSSLPTVGQKMENEVVLDDEWLESLSGRSNEISAEFVEKSEESKTTLNYSNRISP